MPDTAARFGVTNIHDPAQNIRGGTDYMAWLMQRYGGDVRLALAGYNAGEGAVDKYNGVPPYAETKAYVAAIIAEYNRQLAASGATGGATGAAFGLDAGLRPGGARAGFGLGVRANRFGLDASVTARATAPKLDEAWGLSRRDFREHGDRAAPGRVDYVKIPIYEKGQLVGYQAVAPTDLRAVEYQGLISRDASEHRGMATVFKQAATVGAQATRQLESLPVSALATSTSLASLAPVTQPLVGTLAQAEDAAQDWARQVIQSGKATESVGQRLQGMMNNLGGMLPQQQVGQKRGFFSKLLGFASLGLGFVPGVGPLLSTLTGIASSAVGGDWAGALTQGVAGFQSRGAFRSSGGGARNSQGVPYADYGGARATGGPVSRGRAYLVGERRPELFVPDDDGWIHPSVRPYAGSGGGDGHWHALLARIDATLSRHAAAIEKFETAPPDHVLMKGARTPAGQAAIGRASQEHFSRDARALDWQNRRAQGVI